MDMGARARVPAGLRLYRRQRPPARRGRPARPPRAAGVCTRVDVVRPCWGGAKPVKICALQNWCVLLVFDHPVISLSKLWMVLALPEWVAALAACSSTEARRCDV